MEKIEQYVKLAEQEGAQTSQNQEVNNLTQPD